MKVRVALVLASLWWGTAAAAQVAAQSDRHAGGTAGHDYHSMAMPGQDRLGTISFPNSGNAAAQTDFLDGVKLLHNFGYEQAIDAFQRAQKADPTFALAYWGEAMAHNYTLWSEQHVDAARAALAKLGPNAADRAKKAKTERERMYLDAIEVLYGTGTKAQRDAAYAAKMDRLANAYPDDVEAQVFDALAIMGLTNGTRDVPNYMRAAAMLEKLYPSHPAHPGIVHYLIHAYDDPAHAKLGLRMARVYDQIAPDSPHAQHMTSHIFLALGMWPEVERANVNARRAIEALRGPDHRFACGHGGIWLVYARLQQGLPVDEQVAECRMAAEAGLKDSKTVSRVGFGEGNVASHADMAVRRSIETGGPVERIALPDGLMNNARFTYAYGQVLAARHDPVASRAALAELAAAHAILASDYRKEFPDDDQTMPWIDLAFDQANAVAALAGQAGPPNLSVLRALAERESALPAVFGPPMLLKPGWELLGDEYLAIGDKTAAAAAYRQSLTLQPGRRLSLAGLARAGASTAAQPRELLFADEFGGPALDRGKWNVEGDAFWVNNEQQAYVDSPQTIAVSRAVEGAPDGALVLKPVWKPGYVTSKQRKADFISGRIDSKGKFDFAYGRAEARIRMTDHVGVWPAWWMLGNGQWPDTGEIDIMEYVGDRSWTGVAVHGPGYSGDRGPVNRYYFRPGEPDVTAWHVYGVDWTPDLLTFTVDGNTAFTVPRATIEHNSRWAFDNPKYLILNFALGGAYPSKVNNIKAPYDGMPQATVDAIKHGEVAMYVDWVRVSRARP
jgi:beta-glucanase (GH16 family)